MLHRSYLYASGARPELFAKAVGSGADAVILDLEDSVRAPDKAAARGRVARFVAASAASARCAVQVRVNRRPGGYDPDDVAAVVAPGLDALRLPKAESADELCDLGELLDTAERSAGVAPGAIGLYPTIESARGALNAAAIAGAGPRVRRIGFGAADFLADIGAWQSAGEQTATLHARSALVLVSRAAGIGPPIDSVHTDVHDDEGLRASATFARDLGFFGKSVVHPRQIRPVHDVFTPAQADVERAGRIVTAYSGSGEGAMLLDGELLDEAVVLRARAVLAVAERQPG